MHIVGNLSSVAGFYPKRNCDWPWISNEGLCMISNTHVFRRSVRSVYIFFLFQNCKSWYIFYLALEITNMKHFGGQTSVRTYVIVYFIRLAIWPTGLLFCLLIVLAGMILMWQHRTIIGAECIRHDILVIEWVRSYEYWSTVLAHDR